MMIKTLIASAALIALLPAHAVTTAQWDFEAAADLPNSSTSPAVAASTGTGTASGVHASSASDWTTPVGNGSANSFSANTWAIGDYWQFSFSTTGYADLTFSFDQTSSNTGPRDFKLAYSTDGSTFVDFATYSVLANDNTDAWSSSTYKPQHTMTMDLSAVSALDNQASVVLRLINNTTVSANGGAVGTGGTDRIDNFTVNVTAVPEPGSYALLLAGLAGVGAIVRRRRTA